MFSISYLAAGVVGVFGQFAVESLEENLIRDFAHIHTGFVQHGEDAFMLLLHQIHNDLVIEVINLTTKHTEEGCSSILDNSDQSIPVVTY